MIKTKDLYTTKDTAEVRILLTKEQDNKDALTGLDIPPKQHCLDHCHDSEQFVRGVLHRQSNACLGKIENLYVRYLSYWYPNNLQTFLRATADYLDKEPDKRFRHPGWIKKVKVLFNKLSAKEQNIVLESLAGKSETNPSRRKESFAKLCLDRSIGFDLIMKSLKEVKTND